MVMLCKHPAKGAYRVTIKSYIGHSIKNSFQGV